MLSKEVRILLSSIIVCGVVAVLLVQYTDICNLQAVTLNGERVRRVEELGLFASKPIVFQPVDSLADMLMTRRGITKVDIDYALPNGLRITTNELEPVSYLLDSKTGNFYGLEESGRVVPVEMMGIDWNAPLFTGVAVKRMHEFPPDGRVMQILSQMRRLKETDPRLYTEIEEIDLSSTESATLVLANKPYRLKLHSDQFEESYRRFDQFMTTFRPETDSVTSFDLTYNDLIIRSGYVAPKEKPIIDTAEVNDKAAFLDDSDMLQASITSEMQSKRSKPATTIKPTTKPASKAKAPSVTSKKPTAKKSSTVTTGKKTSTGNKSSKPAVKSGKKSSSTKKSTTGKPTTKGAKHG